MCVCVCVCVHGRGSEQPAGTPTGSLKPLYSTTLPCMGIHRRKSLHFFILFFREGSSEFGVVRHHRTSSNHCDVGRSRPTGNVGVS